MKNRISSGKLLYYRDSCGNPEVMLIAQELYEWRMKERPEDIESEQNMCDSCDVENPSCDLCVGC